MTTPTPQRTTYISSGGQPLATPPLTARITRGVDNIYNFFGLYFVSLFSLDPYTSAQNSSFNTRGPGRTATSGSGSTVPRWGSGTVGGVGGNARGGGNGGGGGGAGPGSRRLGTVDDVRGPECGSCG